MEFTSNSVQVSKSPEDIFALFENLENMKMFMPESVERFESDENTFVFGLKGMPDVRLLVDEKVVPSLMKFKAASSKLDFTLACNVLPSATGSEVHYEFLGNFNPMMKMMVERPLKRFIEDLAEATGKL
jgi:carbon monoxide dehydrogenase subunit G